MPDEPDSLVLRYLRRIDEKVDQLGLEMTDLKGRVGAVETGLNAVRRDLVALSEADARLMVTVDRLSERFGRMERRLELNESA
ncbi:MAG TPA: hypothetical protein VNT30_06755 [Stellaceae bacterium]|nr:hypothetical protein [Stellaceae bacterium]